jgi:hypothetical protein
MWSMGATGVLAVAFFILALVMTIVAAKKELAITITSMSANIAVLEGNVAEELERKRQARPDIKAEINIALRDRFNESGLCLVHVHFVNTGGDPVTIKRVHLIHHQGNGKFVAILFNKRQIVKGREKWISLAEIDGRTRRRETVATDEILDILDSIRSAALVKGHARIGWLAFEIPYCSNECECPSLSLLIEDSFGEMHPNAASLVPFDYGVTFNEGR